MVEHRKTSVGSGLRQEQREEEPGNVTLSGWGLRVGRGRWILDHLGEPTGRTAW